MLDTKELDQVRDYVIEILPELLRKDPRIATTIEGILAQHFPRRDEFARLLDEVQAMRQDNNQRFEQVDRRFEQVDRRFEQVDQRFEKVEQRLDRIEQTQLTMRRDLVKLQSSQETLIKRMDGMQTWVDFVLGNLRNEKGQALEDLVAAALRYGLHNPHIMPENIRLRQRLVDYKGEVFPADFETELDVIVENGELLVFEVKAGAKATDVSIFALKVKLVAAQNPSKRVLGVFITLAASAEVREQCLRYGLDLIDSSAGKV
ncbi:MAG: hypothetical protein U0350_23200 [Caldilineaceae bacterium]